MPWRCAAFASAWLALSGCTNDIHFNQKQQLATAGAGPVEGLAPQGPTGAWEPTFAEECEAELDPGRINNFMPDASGEPVHIWEPRGEYINEGNLSVQGGDCLITAQRLSMGARDWVSGTLNTAGHFEQQYGYFETRVWPPEGAGFWTFWWLRASGNHWPPAIEPLNFSMNEPHYTAQFYDANGNQHSTGVDVPALTDGYHTVGVEWTESELVFYFDGAEQGRLATDVENLTEPLYPIFNLSINTGEYGAPVPDATTPAQAELRIDWLRVWRRP